MTAGGAPGPRSMRWRYAVWLAATVLFLLNFFRRGIDLFSVALTAIIVALSFAIEQVETRTRRPLRNFLRVALASFALALVLILMPVMMGAGLWIGLILWAALSGGALVWCVYYERTEPL